MGGAASKDFLDSGPKTAGAKELDELGGYDRPAVAKNRSFTARLDWLGAQVGRTSEQIEAALCKDDQAMRRELEKEAKRRQLMVLRRGQGDAQLNSQFADFFLKQKQFESGRTMNNSSSILRNSHIAGLATDMAESSDLSSNKKEAARRTAEQVATLQRLYSTKQGPMGPASSPAGSKPDAAPAAAAVAAADSGGSALKTAAGGNSKWRQTVQHAKKTAYLAVGAYVAMNGKKRVDGSFIDNFALFAEQQLGDGVQKFVQEGERLISAQEKLPDMKAELENLRSAMRQLAIEQQAIESSYPAEIRETHDGEATRETTAAARAWEMEDEDDGEDEVGSAEEMTVVAAAAAASMRNPRPTNNKPRWHPAGGANGFNNLSGGPRTQPGKGLRDAPTSAPPGGPSHAYASPMPPASGLPSVSAPLATTAPHATSRRRATTAGTVALAKQASNSSNGSFALQLPNSAAAAATATSGLARGRGTHTRASWSGAISQNDGLSSGIDALMAFSAQQQQHGTPLRPSRPSAPGNLLRISGPGIRGRSDASGPALGTGAGGNGGPARPASPVRCSPLGPGPQPPSPSCGNSPVSMVGGRQSRPVLGPETPTTPGEYRVGSMAQRIASKIALPMRAVKHQLRSLRDAETANALRQQQLLADIEENAAVLQSSSGLLNMYCNRANGRWVEAQQWTMSPVHEVALPRLRQLAARYREVVLADLRQGRVAVQIHVDDDVFVSGRLGSLAMWSVDPWQLLAQTHPARTEWTSHLVGLGMGVRQLTALATTVESAVGLEAVGRMQVVISCHEGQVEAVVRDLAARKMCRFNPDNVIISVQQRAPGHMYDKTKRAFVAVPTAPRRAAGSGYALLALCWAGPEAFRLGGPDLSQRRPLERPALDSFLDAGVTWLSSWRLRDLVHFSPDTCLNLEQLALSYALADSIDANMSMQVELVESLHGINRYGSGIVLSLKERATVNPVPPSTSASTNVPILNRNNGRAAVHVSHGSGPSAASTSPTATKAAASATPHASLSPMPVDSPHDAPMQPPTPPLPHPQPQPPTQPPPASQSPLRPLQGPLQRQSVSAPSSQGTQRAGAPASGSSLRSPVAAVKGANGGDSNASRRPWGRAGGIGCEGGPLPMCDVKWPDVQTPALAAGLQQLLDMATIQSGSVPRVPVSIKRYMYHVPSLKGILTGTNIFRPSVSIGDGGFLYVTFDASDITAQPAARCVALSYSSRHNGEGGSGGSGGDSSAAATAPCRVSSTHGNLVVGSSGPAAASSGGGGGGGNNNAVTSTNNSNNNIMLATASAAAAALQRGRLLTNDTDLDTLLWVMGEQDNHPGFRASVSATNTARSRVTSHAAGGVAGATGFYAVGPSQLQLQQRIIVVAVTDDAACHLAIRVAMAVMKPGADCLHVLTIAKDHSSMAMSAARAVVERFETIAAATLGDIKSVVQVKRQSIVEDIAAYTESVRAVLLVVGSMSLAAPQGSSVVGSVALSLARDFTRPILVVKPTARLVESAYEVGKKQCLRVALAAETNSRLMVRFIVDHILDGARGDKLVLIRGRAFDKDMQELSSSRRILDHLAEEAVANRRFESSLLVRRMVPNAFESECQRVADADQCHILALQVPECRGPLPAPVIQLLRTSRSAVLVYRTFQGKAAPPVVTAGATEGDQQPEP